MGNAVLTWIGVLGSERLPGSFQEGGLEPGSRAIPLAPEEPGQHGGGPENQLQEGIAPGLLPANLLQSSRQSYKRCRED